MLRTLLPVNLGVRPTKGQAISIRQVYIVSLRAAVKNFRSKIAHWGPVEIGICVLVWASMSAPLYFIGWGIASLLSLPLAVLAATLLGYFLVAIVAVLDPLEAPKPPPEPRPGLTGEIQDNELGKFTLSSYSSETYVGAIDWLGTHAELVLSGILDAEAAQAVFREASVIYKGRSDIDAQLREYTTSELLPVINEELEASQTPPLTADQFQQSIALECIEVELDGTYTFTYADGDLFGGHWIEVRGNRISGPTDIGLSG